MKKLIFSIFVLLISLGTKAQRHEIGPFVGLTYYMGDLVESRMFSTPGYNFGLNYRYSPGPRFAVKIAAHYGMVKGDSENNKETLQYHNLEFFSNILDIEAGIELNFLEYMPGSTKHRFTPYIFGGVAIFRFNPKSEFNGEVYELQPLGTEGQNLTTYPDKKFYSLTSFAIPFGFGFKYNISKKVSIGLEWGMRKTFTDYLDDVSTRYADPGVLAAQRSYIASGLSNRIYEDQAIEAGLDISIGANGIPNNQDDYNTYMEFQQGHTGSQRGGEESKDWYSIAGFTMMFKITGPKKAKCPAYRQHNYYKEYIPN